MAHQAFGGRGGFRVFLLRLQLKSLLLFFTIEKYVKRTSLTFEVSFAHLRMEHQRNDFHLRLFP